MELFNHSLCNDSALKAYYRFESGALTTDSTANGHTLTAISDPASVTGYYGGGVDLDSNDAYSATDHSDFRPTGPFTIGGRIKTSVYPVGIFHSRTQDTGKYYGIWLNLFTNGTVRVGSAKGTGGSQNIDYQVANSTTVVSNNAWHFIVGTWDESNLKIYVDGLLEATVSWTAPPVYFSTNYIRIGCTDQIGTPVQFLTGSLDEVFLFNGKALSATEVSDLYYELKNASLNLSAYYQKLTNFEAYLRAHDGLEFRDLQSYLSVISGFILKDGKLNLDVAGQNISDFIMGLAASKIKMRDLVTYLSATDGTVLNNWATWLTVTDGTTLKDLGVYLQTISAIPAFRSVTAHRLSSVMSEVI